MFILIRLVYILIVLRLVLLRHLGEIFPFKYAKSNNFKNSARTFNPVTIVDQEENNKDITTIRLYFPGDSDDDENDEILRISTVNYDYILDQ
ncbi:hypothetical protein HYV10_02215 [Candidatus Dependentiae bacterium]|nr:hypothetical protein [Candidatus Dependentiae bacterium]